MFLRKKVAKFEKVSYEEFKRSCLELGFGDLYDDAQIMDFYKKIKLPVRSTGQSAGYDFFCPIDFACGEWKKIPTGVKCRIKPYWFLMLTNKSGLSERIKIRFSDTVGIIDADYYNCEENEGHIFIEISSEKCNYFEAGHKICQGIFLQYGITTDDYPRLEKRIGGYGSTGTN